MAKNMGTIDRIVRIILGLVIISLLFAGTLNGLSGIILGIFAVIFLATSIISSCPLYTLVNVSTRKQLLSAK